MPVQDLFVHMMYLFVIGVVIFIALHIKNQVLPTVKGMLSEESATVIASTEWGFQALDQIFFFVAIGLGIGSIILAFFVENPPIFFFLGVVLLAISMVVFPAIANAFQNISETAQFSGYVGDYPMMMFIFQHLPLFYMIFGFIILVVVFAKWRGVGGGV